MKKMLIIFLFILGAFSLNACKEKDNEIIEPVEEDKVLVIDCEDDWKNAFKRIKFDNFSFDFTTDLSYYKNYSGLICDDGCYIKSKTFTQTTIKTSHYDSEIYYKETKDSYHTYYEKYQNIVSTHQYVEFGTDYMVNEQKAYPTLEEALKNRCWTKAFSGIEGEKGYKEYIQKYSIDVTPFKEMFQKFNYNEKEKNYSYSGRIDCTFLNEEVGLEKQFICIDPVITFKYYNEIQSIHFKFERMGQIDRDNMGLVTGEMNYYNFRTTRIPYEVKSEILKLAK